MRRIVAGEYITLDGVVEAGWAGHKPALAPGDELAGSYFDEEVGQTIGALTAAADTLLLGRVTYEGFAAFFSGQTGGMADQMNNLPKVVVSSTLDKAEWQNSTVVSGDLTREISRLKQQPGKNIAVSGSATLVRWLLRNRLLDELHLLVLPVVLGGGKRLFEDGGDRVRLTLNSAKALSNGVVHLIYQPA